jgi:hypothetical protein
MGLAQSLWPLTKFTQFHEALGILLAQRQKVWIEEHDLVANFNSPRQGLEITTLHREVEDNVKHIKSWLRGSVICKGDRITFRGPYVSTGKGRPIIITVRNDLVEGEYVGNILFTPFILPLKDMRSIEYLGVSIVPGCMSGWANWCEQKKIALLDSPKPPNETCPYPLYTEYLPVNNPLLQAMTRMSIESMIMRHVSNGYAGISLTRLRDMSDSEFFQAIQTARRARRISTSLDLAMVRSGLVELEDESGVVE